MWLDFPVPPISIPGRVWGRYFFHLELHEILCQKKKSLETITSCWFLRLPFQYIPFQLYIISNKIVVHHCSISANYFDQGMSPKSLMQKYIFPTHKSNLSGIHHWVAVPISQLIKDGSIQVSASLKKLILQAEETPLVKCLCLSLSCNQSTLLEFKIGMNCNLQNSGIYLLWMLTYSSVSSSISSWH